MNIFKSISILFSIFGMIILPCSSGAVPLDTWVTVTSGTDDWFWGLAYGNGTFVTVGDYGTILTSPDGVAWTPQTSGITDYCHLYGVGFGNNIFVAVGTTGTILSSSDGVNWTLRNSGQAHPVSQDLFGVTYGAGKFVVVGGHGTILTSSDNGVTWDDPFWPYSAPAINRLYDSIYNNDIFIDVGEYGTILYSTNAVAWYLGDSAINRPLAGVAYGNGTFLAVGQYGTILTSSNGAVWSPQTSGVTNDLFGVDFDNNTFVAVGKSGRLITSPDGINWTVRNSGTTYDLEEVAYHPNIGAFAAVGESGAILLDVDSILNPLVKSTSTPSPPTQTIQYVYDTAVNGDTIKAMALHFNETLTFNAPISVTVQGGYDSAYSSNSSATTINGTITVSNGTVVMDKIIIQ